MTRRTRETDSDHLEGGPTQVTRRMFLRGLQAVAVAVPAAAVLSSCGDATDPPPKADASPDIRAVDSAPDQAQPDAAQADAPQADAPQADAASVDSMIDTTLQADSEPDM